MMLAFVALATLIAFAVLARLVQRAIAVRAAGDRLDSSLSAVLNLVDRSRVAAAEAPRPITDAHWARPLARPLRWLPYAMGGVISLILHFLTAIPTSIVGATGLVAALLLAQVESAIHARRLNRIELQLIDLLDMMVPMLRSGAGASAALGAAAEVAGSPLRQQIQWCVRRIQLGDSGSAVFQTLARRMPIDAMDLFATTMSVHWETGGSLAPVLASVARVARDRQDVARRIRSNIAQSQFSTVAVLLLIYFVALVLWLDRPDVMREFATTTLGSAAIATTMVLQAVGIAWMNMISRPKA